MQKKEPHLRNGNPIPTPKMDKINTSLKTYGISDKIKQMNEGFGGGRCYQEVNDFYLKGHNLGNGGFLAQMRI